MVCHVLQVTHDAMRGPLVFLRILSGSIRAQSPVYNLTRSQRYVLISVAVPGHLHDRVCAAVQGEGEPRAPDVGRPAARSARHHRGEHCSCCGAETCGL